MQAIQSRAGRGICKDLEEQCEVEAQQRCMERESTTPINAPLQLKTPIIHQVKKMYTPLEQARMTFQKNNATARALSAKTTQMESEINEGHHGK